MLEPTVKLLQDEWTVIKTSLGKTIKKDFKPACSFLMHALDVLILAAEQNISTSGADKKAAVIAAFVTMFTTVIVPIMPFYLQPFAGKIQNFIIATVVSVAIDFVVGLYNKTAGGVPVTAPASMVRKPRKRKK